MFYRSERLFLRPAFPEDAREMYEGDLRCRRRCRCSPARRGRIAWRTRRHSARCPSIPSSPRFLITLPGRKGAPIVGVVGFHPNADGIELGYWIARNHWGRGYATEAGRGALAVARRSGTGG